VIIYLKYLNDFVINDELKIER